MSMKPNIDLTINGDFSAQRLTFDDVLFFIRSQDRKYPWSLNFLEKLALTTSCEKEIFLTGSKEDRARKKEYLMMNEENCCDCCGAYSQKLWTYRYNLCKKCNDFYEEAARKERLWFIKKYKG